MTLDELQKELAALDIQLRAEGDRLHVDAPRGVLTPQLKSELSRLKPEILAELTRTSNPAASAEIALKPMPRPEDIPLSFAQSSLWVFQQLNPDSYVYNIALTSHFDGFVDVAVLEQSLNQLVRRHESLRTTFYTRDGMPFQKISPPGPVALCVQDLSDLPETQQDAYVQRLMQAESSQPFDLEQGPLFRVFLYRLGSNRSIVLFLMHHIISDGWSLDVMARELASLYATFAAGQLSPLAELPIQYPDYALWQRQWLHGQTLVQDLGFWREKLADCPILDLPTDLPRPPEPSYRGALETLVLPAELVDNVKRSSQREQVTLFVVLLAAFQTLLYRYTRMEDIVLGTPMANRTRLQVEGLIGFFVNTVVLRTDLKGTPSFRALLQRVRESALEAFAHQEIPFEVLVEKLHPERDRSRSPFFQVMFVFEKTKLNPLEVDNGTAKYDLTLYTYERGKEIHCKLEYSTDLFERATITRLLAHYQQLLLNLVANPDELISAVPFLTPSEYKQLMFDWNQTASSYPENSSLQELFREQAERTPGATAFIFEDGSTPAAQQLSYRELDRRSGQLAEYLQHLGVKRGTLVGLAMDRSLEMAVGILGVLKAGGAYVPLDPSYPRERLAIMLQDAKPPIVLTRQKFITELPEHDAIPICLDSDWQKIAQLRGELKPPGTVPDDTAYVIYTSGSTGKPKGVRGVHRGAVNRFHWMWQVYPFTMGEVCCQKTSLNFVDSVWEFFGPLLRGVPTVILSDPVVKDSSLLIQALSRHKISRLVLVPSLLRVLLETENDLSSKLPNLKYWVSSGEALGPDLAKLFFEVLPDAMLLNLYGSSEVAGDSTYYLLDKECHLPFVPLGRPIANTQIFILDPDLQPVPIGVRGELYIGGVGLARGYWNRSELTLSKFIPNPFDPKAKNRLYKTGDLACYLPDGNIRFLGRYDYQIKIRGIRVETEEIQAALRQHPAVADAVVALREKNGHGAMLVGYVIPKPGMLLAQTDLQSFAKTRFIDVMRPSAWVVLDTFPLTPNGKVDRNALPPPKVEPHSARTIAEPRDDLERQLLQIWEKILGLTQISIDDDFFDLGGHSLLAIRLFSEIEKHTSKKLPVATLFHAATIRQLSHILRQKEHQVDWATVIPIQTGGDKPPFFCVHGLGGEVIGYQELARLLGPDQPFYGLQAKGLDGKVEPLTKIEEMAADYIKGMQSVQPTGPYYIGGYCYGGVIAFEMARQLATQGQSSALCAIFEGFALPRLSPGQLLRNRAYLVSFLQNFPRWLRDNLSQQARRVPEWFRPPKSTASHPWNPELDMAALPEAKRTLMRNHLYAIQTYIPHSYPGRVTLFRVSTLPLFRAHDPTMGWGNLAEHGVDIQMVAGAHFNIMEQPHVKGVADQLKKCLAVSQGAESLHQSKPKSDQPTMPNDRILNRAPILFFLMYQIVLACSLLQ